MRIRILGFMAVTLTGVVFAEVNARPQMQVRLQIPVSSFSAVPGDEITSVVVAPARQRGRVVIPRGSLVRGKVEQASKVGLGLVRASARLELSFTEVEFPDGKRYPIESQVIGVDNAREWVDTKGAIRGRRVTGGLVHRLGMSIFSIAIKNPAGFLPWFAIQTCLFRFPNPEIDYPTGTELQLELRSVPEDESDDVEPAPALSEPELERLQAIVDRAPYWSYSVRQRDPMDIISLLFVGSSDAIRRAFIAAGWSGSIPNSAKASVRAVRAFAEQRPYAEAPMRTLLANGSAPEMAWQKSLNTFTKRHHLRIWQRPEQFRDQPVWLSAATHDVSVSFSLRYGFVHRIDNKVDREREKVINDLLLTGCVDQVINLPRHDSMRLADGADRARLETDGVVSALVFNDCAQAAPFRRDAPPASRPGIATRVVRQMTLSARNHFIENNLPWQLSETAVRAARSRRKQAVTSRASELPSN